MKQTFIFLLWQTRKLHRIQGWNILLFMIGIITITTIVLQVFSLIEKQDWGIYGLGINGWIIESGYVLCWFACCLCFRKTFVPALVKPMRNPEILNDFISE